MGCGRLALERAGIKVDKYYASEIDKYAMQIANKNFPDIIQLGDINNWEYWFRNQVGEIDLLIAGSPCQGFSRAGKLLNFDDPRSKLFFTFVDILNFIQPTYFLLENVVMKKEWQDIITEHLFGIEPIKINSALVSAQNRTRLYWTNINIDKGGIPQPEDKGILLKDIVLEDALPIALHNIYGGFNENSVRVFEDKSPTLRTPAGGGHIPSLPITFTERRTENAKEIRRKVKAETGKDFCPRRDKEIVARTDGKIGALTTAPTVENLILSQEALAYMDRKVEDGRSHWDFEHYSDITKSKSSTIVANFFKGVPYNVFKDLNCIRKLHPIECERLQTLEDNYTEGVSNTQRYKMIGNGWTIDIIKHIFDFLPERYKNESL